MVKYKRILDKSIAYFKKNGVRQGIRRIYRKLWLARPVNYEAWLRKAGLSVKEIQALERQYADVISQMAVCESLQEVLQTEKPYVVVVPKKGRMERGALALFTEAVVKEPQADLFYCDSDRLQPDGVHLAEPLFKPDFDAVLLEGMSYIDGGFLIKKELLQLCRKDALAALTDGRHWAYELFRLCSKKSNAVFHIARVLYHAPADVKILYRSSDKALSGRHLVSVLIPNKDQVQMLRSCVESIYAYAGDAEFEILILENNSEEAETFSYYKELERSGKARIVSWKGGFDYAAINNYGAEAAKGDYLLFLNNDTEFKSADVLVHLMAAAEREDVGAVGAKLFYPDGTLQHAGVILGYGGIAGHVFEGMTESELQEIPWSRAVRQYSAVTAACMLVKKEVFAAVGGFDEAFRVAYNDIDLCLRIRAAGKKVLYTPFAQLIHYESATRGLELTKEKAQRANGEAEYFCRRWQKELAAGDPFYNPNLTLEKNDYSLRR